MALLHASAPTTGSGLLCAGRHYHGSRSATCGSLQASAVFRACPREPDQDATGPAATGASPACPFLVRPYPAPFLPASSCPQPPSAPWPGPVRRQAVSPRPKPTVRRENRGAKRGDGGGSPARHSHHRGRWLGRKAEARKWPGPRRLPFPSGAAAVSAQPSGRYHLCSGRGKGGLGTLGPLEFFPLLLPCFF